MNSCISQLFFRKIFVILENPERLSFLFEGEFVLLKFDKLWINKKYPGHFQYLSILLEYILHKFSDNSLSLSWQVSIQTLRYLFIQGSVLPTRLSVPRIATSLKQRQQRRLHCIQDLCHECQQLAPRKILQQNCYYYSFVINVAGLCTPVKAQYVRTSSCCPMHVEIFVGGQLLPQVLYRPSAPSWMVLEAVTPFLSPSNCRAVTSLKAAIPLMR